MSLNKKTRTIYIISSMLYNKSYIGSTCSNLNRRLDAHNSCRNKTSSKEVIKHGNIIIAPLLIIENCTKREIEIKEQEFIKLYQKILVNKRKSFLTHEEHLEQKRIRNKTKNECECGITYTSNNKKQHLNSKKHITFLSNNNA